MGTTLGAFFGGVVPLLTGDDEGERLENVLGPSLSGRDRLKYYRTLQERTQGQILRSLFPSTWFFLSARGEEYLRDLVDTYARIHPARDTEPNLFGIQFPEFLSDQEGCAIWAELADFEWCSYALSVATSFREPFGERPWRLTESGRPFVVRLYQFKVAELEQAGLRGQAPLSEEPSHSAFLFFRDRQGKARRQMVAWEELTLLAGKEAPKQSPEDPARVSARLRLAEWGLLESE